MTRVPSRGSANAKIMVVGEAPGAQEEREGRPFVGPAGMLLQEMLIASGIDPSQVYYANLSKIRPPGNELRAFYSEHKLPSGEKIGLPNDALLRDLAELQAEIEFVNPNLIIPLGNYPLRHLTGVGRWSKQNGYTGIGDYRGSILQGSALAGGRKCIPTYHPAALLRQYPWRPIVKHDLARAARESGHPEIRRPVKSIIIDPRGPERAAWVQWLISPPGTLSPLAIPRGGDGLQPQRYPSAPFASADIEFIGSKLLCCGVTRHADVAVVLGISTRGDLEELRAVLTSGIPFCWQNAMFDASVLEWHFSISAMKHVYHDTMYMMHSAYTEFPKDLGFIGSLYTDQPNWKDMVDWDKIKAGTQPITDVLEYNAIDTWVTHAAAEQMLADEMQDPDVRNTYLFEIAMVEPLWEIARRGVRIDVEGMTALRNTLETEASTLKAGLAHINGGVMVNPKSGPMVAKFLYETLEVPRVGKKTPKGAWVTDDTTLGTLLLKCKNDRQRTGIRLIREARERLDLISKFCNIDLDDDGRMRCHYDPAKTQTGRLASRKFSPTGRGANLQNIPRDDRVRAVFTADPGYVFGYSDLKSAESFCVAHITGDSEMLRLHSEEFLSGGQDGHKYVASFLFDKPMEEITKDERYFGKKTRHGANYMLSWFYFMTLINAEAQKTGLTVTAADAKRLLAKYQQLHPGLAQWWRRVQAQLYKNRTIHTMPIRVEPGILNGIDEEVWLSRPHVFYDRVDNVLPEAVAQNPQGTVANVTDLGIIRVHRDPELKDLGFQTLLQVHDAIGYQVPRSNAARATERLQELMKVDILVERQGIEPYILNIPVDPKLGLNWGEFDPKNPDRNPNGLRDWQEFLAS